MQDHVEFVPNVPGPQWPIPTSIGTHVWLAGGNARKNKQRDPKTRKELDEDLQEGLEDTFLAFDPVSVSLPTTTGAPGEFRKKPVDQPTAKRPNKRS